MVILIIILLSGTDKAPEFCQSDCIFIKKRCKDTQFWAFYAQLYSIF